jgi:hypothetical protein
VGANEVIEIRRIVIGLERDEAAQGPGAGPRSFASFTVPQGDKPWIESYLSPEETIINMYFPFKGDPLTRITNAGVWLPPGAKVTELGEGLFCTLSCRRLRNLVLARLIDALFTRVLDCGESYDLDMSVEALAPE